MLKLANGLVAVLVGVGGSVLLYWLLNWLVELLPVRAQERVRPYVFVGPAVAIVTLFLVYPTVNTVFLSFFGRRSEDVSYMLVVALLGLVVGLVVWALTRLATRGGSTAGRRAASIAGAMAGVATLLVVLFVPGLYQAYVAALGGTGAEPIGFANYVTLFGEREFRSTLFNNLLWIIIVPAVAVGVGLAVATLADRLKPRAENVAKSLIFLPMAISFVGASTIWLFIYALRPEGRPQIGLLNQLVVAFGGSPVGWLQNSSGQSNDLLLMVIMVWLQAGFAMVLLSAAIKSVPEDTIEAARIDGASELQIFWRVVVPQIRSTIAVVFTTILILVLKVFDIVYVMTGGNFGTDVIGNRFFNELFSSRNSGASAAIVVILLIAVTPVMIYNIRRFRAEEAIR